MTGTMGFNLNIDWNRYNTPVRVDVMCLILAVLLHVPLNFIKIDAHKKAHDTGKNRLDKIVMIDQIEEKKDIPLPAPIAAPKMSLSERIKALMHKAPPPPPPPKPVEPPKQLADVPKPIELQPKLVPPPVIQPKIQGKEGFKTTADAKLVEKNMALKGPDTVIAPLSAKKLGTIEPKVSKSNKGNFHVNQNESLKSIGGGPAIADASAPRIAIATGKGASTEKFSAPPPQIADKGRLGNVPGGNLDGQKLGLRDTIIARDAPASQINTAGATKMGMPIGGGNVAVKQNAGHFDNGASGGMSGGTGLAGNVAAPKISAGTVAPPKKKKEMFQLTGELKDRARTHQEVPQYPAWAEAKGIEAAVVLQFAVNPDGSVKDSIVVLRTSGYPELDDLAKKALRKWQFVPLTDGENREEVGSITFNYTLS